MTSEELRQTSKQQPFEPFRLVMTDGVGYDIGHPDFLMIGRHTAFVGLPGQPGDVFYERSVKVDLRHVIRVEMNGTAPPPPGNGAAGGQ